MPHNDAVISHAAAFTSPVIHSADRATRPEGCPQRSVGRRFAQIDRPLWLTALGARGAGLLRAPGAGLLGRRRPGPPGALRRPARFPLSIGVVWCFCMGTPGAYSPRNGGVQPGRP